MPPSGVAKTTGGGGGWWRVAWDEAASARTADGSGGRCRESRVAGAEGQQWPYVSCCGGGCCGVACMLPPGVAETTGVGGGWWKATREGAT
eukprot:5210972-Prymnesium_polylepis.1